MRFIDEHKDRFGGVEPICRVLREYGWQIAPSGYWAAKKRPPSARQLSDTALLADIDRIHADNYGVYGVRKVWHQLRREGHPVARCTVERTAGLAGARRGRKVRTTIAAPGHQRAADLVNRHFTAARPNRTWVADFTHVATWAGIVYVAFAVDVYSRAIVAWSAAGHKRTSLVLAALDMALWRRDRAGRPVQAGLIHHSDAGSQPGFTSFRFTAHLLAAGVDRQRRGRPGQRIDGVHHRPIQDRADQTPRPVAQPRRGRVGHRRVGRLVQHQPAALGQWACPTGRVRIDVLRSTPAP